MPQNILEVIERLPQRAKTLLDSAIKLADEDLKLQVVDSSVILLAIIKLGNGNASAKWLYSTGLTEAAIYRIIQKDFARREESKPTRGSGVGKRPNVNVLVCTPAVIQMASRLDRFAQEGRTTDAVYISHVLEAVAYSDSTTVRRIFALVGLDMHDVRSKLNRPTILDLEKLYAQSH